MIFRSKFYFIFLCFFCAFCGSGFGESFRFSDQIKGRFIEKVLRDYPMLATKDISVSIQSEPYLGGMVGDCVSFSFSFPEHADVMGRTLTSMSFLDSQGQLKQKLNVVVDVEAKAHFIRTKRIVKKYERLNFDNTQEVVLPMKGYNKSHLLALQSFQGKQALSTLASDTVLATWMMDDIPLIRSGDRIKVLIQKSGYELNVKGMAMDNGGKDQKIRVQLELDSRKVLQCEVVNETTVRYQGMY